LPLAWVYATNFQSAYLRGVVTLILRRRIMKSSSTPKVSAEPGESHTIPLLARIDVLPFPGGDQFLRDVFEPLSYAVEATRCPSWSAWRFFRPAHAPRDRHGGDTASPPSRVPSAGRTESAA